MPWRSRLRKISPVPVVPASATTGGPVAFEEEDVDDTGDTCADERGGLQQGIQGLLREKSFCKLS
jgi:hypothetical protein